jgi:hypothetical protein
MKRLDCAGRASAISLFAALAIVFGATAAEAHHPSHRHNAVPITHSRHAAIAVRMARPLPDSEVGTPDLTNSGVVLSDPTLSIVSEDKTAQADTPAIVRPNRRIYCVEFARLASGIALFGDAKTWWGQANKAYAQLANPAPGAVMVFSGRKTMRSGHVAVVKRLVGPREVLVDHANWGRDGRIYLNAPVIDVSPNNDWSQVKVWNTVAGTMGTTAYSLKGFIAQRFASN